jgi:hypothetical protein
MNLDHLMGIGVGLIVSILAVLALSPNDSLSPNARHCAVACWRFLTSEMLTAFTESRPLIGLIVRVLVHSAIVYGAIVVLRLLDRHG